MSKRPEQRAKAYAAIDSEREYQDSLRATGRFTEPALPLPGELACIKTYLDKAFDSYTGNPGEAPEETLHIVRKLAAMCVRAMEHHGSYPRLWFEVCVYDPNINPGGAFYDGVWATSQEEAEKRVLELESAANPGLHLQVWRQNSELNKA